MGLSMLDLPPAAAAYAASINADFLAVRESLARMPFGHTSDVEGVYFRGTKTASGAMHVHAKNVDLGNGQALLVVRDAGYRSIRNVKYILGRSDQLHLDFRARGRA